MEEAAATTGAKTEETQEQTPAPSSSGGWGGWFGSAAPAPAAKEEEDLSNTLSAAGSAVTSSLWSTFSAVADSLPSAAPPKDAAPNDDDDLDADLDALLAEADELDSPKSVVVEATASADSGTPDVASSVKEAVSSVANSSVFNASEEEIADKLEKKLETSVAAAETAVTSALQSTFSAVAERLSATNASVAAGSTAAADDAENATSKDANDVDDDQDDKYNDRIATEVDATIEAAATKASSFFSAIGSAVTEAGAGDAASSLYSLYNSQVNQASVWIEKLEEEATNKDPLKTLRESLHPYLEANPEGSFEEWIRLWIEHDDSIRDDKDLDPHYYAEESPHRRVWNERNYQDGINDENPLRQYVHVGNKKPVKPASEEEEEVVITFDHDPDKPLLPDPLDQPKEGEDENLQSTTKEEEAVVTPAAEIETENITGEGAAAKPREETEAKPTEEATTTEAADAKLAEEDAKPADEAASAVVSGTE